MALPPASSTIMYIGRNPLKIDAELLAHGQRRFNTYCSPCHDRTGQGRGVVGQRAIWIPTNLQEPRVKDMNDGEIFNVITYGRRSMPSYRFQVVDRDRWAIVAYVRALQRTSTGDSRRCAGRTARGIEITDDTTRYSRTGLLPDRSGDFGRADATRLRLSLSSPGSRRSRGISSIPARFFQSYLVGFLFSIFIPLGGLFFLMVLFLTGSAWSVTMRRIVENMVVTLPLGLLLFIPILFGVDNSVSLGSPGRGRS